MDRFYQVLELCLLYMIILWTSVKAGGTSLYESIITQYWYLKYAQDDKHSSPPIVPVIHHGRSRMWETWATKLRYKSWHSAFNMYDIHSSPFPDLLYECFDPVEITKDCRHATYSKAKRKSESLSCLVRGVARDKLVEYDWLWNIHGSHIKSFNVAQIVISTN